MARTPAIEYVQRGAPVLFSRVVRVLLDRAIGCPVGDTPVVADDDDWAQVWTALCRHRIETALPDAISAGAIVISDAAVEGVRARARAAAAQQLKLVAALHRTLELLDGADIEARVLKGLATSALDYPEPAQRRTSDVDVLVRTDDFDRACDVVEASGATSLKPHSPAPHLVERTFRTEDGVEIDIHRRLFRFGNDDGGHFRDPEPIPGGAGLAMPRADRVMHASAHLLLSPPGHRLCSSLFDVGVLGSSPEFDLDEALTRADVFGMRDVVRFSLWMADNVGAQPEAPPPDVDATLINRAHLRVNRRIDLETLAVWADLDDHRGRIAHVVSQARSGPKEVVQRRVGQR